MIRKLEEYEYCSPLATGAIGLSFFTAIIPIITGPVFAHWLNLLALALTLSALFIFLRNLKRYSLLRKLVLLLLMLGSFWLEIYLASIKYGYINWHYVNPFSLEAQR